MPFKVNNITMTHVKVNNTFMDEIIIKQNGTTIQHFYLCEFLFAGITSTLVSPYYVNSDQSDYNSMLSGMGTSYVDDFIYQTFVETNETTATVPASEINNAFSRYGLVYNGGDIPVPVSPGVVSNYYMAAYVEAS